MSAADGTPAPRWAEFSWWCDHCREGHSVADHDRREFPPQCCQSCRRVMTLTVTPLVPRPEPLEGSPEAALRADVDELAGRYQLNATGEITILELGRRAERALGAARLDERERLSARVHENGWCPTCAAPWRQEAIDG